MKRRRFLIQSSSGIAAAHLVATARLQSASKPDAQRVVIGLMGLNRGKDLAANLLKIPGV